MSNQAPGVGPIESFFDSVWMNVFASVLVLAFLLGTIYYSAKLMNWSFTSERYVAGGVIRLILGMFLSLLGAALSVVSLIAIWVDCPADQCF